MVSLLKNKKKRTNSSRAWLTRQLTDPYVAQAKKDGYRARSAFKLIEIDDKFQLLKPTNVVVDLGCAPGGWLQVVAQRVRKGQIIGVDLQNVVPVGDVALIKGDFTEPETVAQLLGGLGGKGVHVVLSDMAAPACGIPSVDALRITLLVRSVADFCDKVLLPGGHMVAKVLRGGTENELLSELKQKFRKVSHFKPASSRADSAEMYLVAIGRKPQESGSRWSHAGTEPQGTPHETEPQGTEPQGTPQGTEPHGTPHGTE
ncbi:MAG: RlmE family RNA methyltransferase [Holosporales bacterium]|jgi:23S rRNA (uridine2552-2'-O)-methyltransferase|nr:RlmE family RNA methyltransferase [Holosporales bacterium]